MVLIRMIVIIIVKRMKFDDSINQNEKGLMCYNKRYVYYFGICEDADMIMAQ